MASLLRLQFKGDFKEFKRFLNHRQFMSVAEEEFKRATLRSSLLLVKEVRSRILNRKYKKNKALTLLLSSGNIPLLKEKELFNAIDHKLESSFRSEVGIIGNKKSSKNAGGKTIGMKRLARLMETGYTIKVTPKMVAVLMAAVKKRGGDPSKFRGSSGSKGGNFFVSKRPFLSSVFDNNPEMDRMVARNWRLALEKTYRRLGAKGPDSKWRGSLPRK